MGASELDTEKLAKVRALMERGATEGERAAARGKAERIAKAAGLSLADALSKLDTRSPAQSIRNIFEGFDDWMEEREPGHEAREAAKRAERQARDDIRRAGILEQYGSEAALFARTEQEQALNRAIAPLATWRFWRAEDGTEHRYAERLGGVKPKCGFWGFEDVTPAIRDAVMGAYPWPSTLGEALREVQSWGELRLDRGLFVSGDGSPGEWNHYAEVECRVVLLERELDAGRAAASWDDVQARFDWKRYQDQRQWIDPTDVKSDPFLDRLEADFGALRRMGSPVHSGRGDQAGKGISAVDTPSAPNGPASVQFERRTNAEKRAAVLSVLGRSPHLSDREIARQAGVSAQTVNTWRKRMAAGCAAPRGGAQATSPQEGELPKSGANLGKEGA
ncbi:transposase [Xanthobacteraceae bacterium A53D]